jgi:hypothetical protein
MATHPWPSLIVRALFVARNPQGNANSAAHLRLRALQELMDRLVYAAEVALGFAAVSLIIDEPA